MGRQLSSAECRRLIGLQIQLEYWLDDSGRLHTSPASSEQAWFIIYRYRGGYVRYFRHDLFPGVVWQIQALPPEQAFDDHVSVCEMLAPHVAGSGPAGGCSVGTFHSCVFATMPLPSDFPDVVRNEEGCYVAVVNGKAVSRAWSSRENDSAAELAVETEERYRQRGLGRWVASAWAYEKMRAGKAAFYSYEENNFPSARLAGSLGVLEYAVVTSYE